MNFTNESPFFGLTKQGEVEIHIRFQPKRVIAIALVLFMHALLLFLLYTIKSDIKNGKEGHNPIVLIFDKIAKVKESKPETKKAEKSFKPIASKTKKSTQPVILADEPRDLPPPPKVTEEPDMMSLLNAARERRQKAEDAAKAENQAAVQGSKGQSAQDIAAANIARSMQQAASPASGTSGVFQIISKSTRMGTFTFRGWKVNSTGWKQTIEVDAGLGGNIDLAMVRKMIEIIRTHYKGDFKWESYRLGRVVNLSARIEDTAELEKFMLEEFPEFATPKR